MPCKPIFKVIFIQIIFHYTEKVIFYLNSLSFLSTYSYLSLSWTLPSHFKEPAKPRHVRTQHPLSINSKAIASLSAKARQTPDIYWRRVFSFSSNYLLL